VIDARVTRTLLSALGLALFTATLVVGLMGASSGSANPAPTWLYVWFWVGLVPASLLLGPVWKVLNPLRTISRGLFFVAGDRRQQGVRAYPESFGYWPAAIGLAVFVWIELVYERAAESITVVVFVSIYSLVQLLGAQLYGRVWFERGDSFEVYSSLLARMSWFGRREDGRLVVRNPFEGLAALKPAPGLVAVITVLLGSTAFDGLSRTPLWTNLTEGASVVEKRLLGTAGLAVAIAFVVAIYSLAMFVSRRALSRLEISTVELQGRFVHSLIPIAIGYTVAHYFSLFVFQGQAGYILASDPLSRGDDFFGTSDWQIVYTVVSTAAIALVQVAAIVAGHVLGVVAAHDRAVGMFSGRDKSRGQYALLGAMVTFTIGGIALLVGT
ncbi:MAG TPA: hypothetical protein VFS38_08065, partial [Actinomycetota bacterium]|nr:hypothetical protein [Actinomycetota bacterium]